MGWKTVATETYVDTALTSYQATSEEDANNGYCGLDANARIATARLATGTADATSHLNGNQAWVKSFSSTTISILVPENATIGLGRFDKQKTIVKVVAVCAGGTVPSCSIQLSHGSNRSSLTTDVFSSAASVSSVTTGDVFTTFSSDTISVDDFMEMDITSMTGDPDELLVTIFYELG